MLFQKRDTICSAKSIGHEKGVEWNIKLNERMLFISESVELSVSAGRRK
jgi:hypothetical protein